jgi:hypothetical protein
MKFIEPNKLLIPDKCKAKIAKSTLGPLWLCIPDKGGYNVHPVPAPFSIVAANKNKIKLGGNNQKLILFSLGKAMSGPPTNNGNKKLPKPPINAGITIKNIINIAWAVITALYSWLSAIYCTPGPDNSILIRTENAVPNRPENNAKIKYNIPISLAFEERNQRSIPILIWDIFPSGLVWYMIFSILLEVICKIFLKKNSMLELRPLKKKVFF